jgi:peroxiredoxin
MGIDDVMCMSVNDPFVMKKWGDNLKIKKVKLIPDGNGAFTKRMGALVPKTNLGFGERSWRYSMLVDNGKIVKVFEEPGRKPNCKTDPFLKSDVNTMLDYLHNIKK